jgi:GNAT superfamily N-acetyltransferase
VVVKSASHGFLARINEVEAAMPLLELLHTRTFDADMDRLRQQCFPGHYSTGSSKDEFDDGSVHMVARADGQVAGAGRLIPRPMAYFQGKSGGQVVVPDEPDMIYFGRLMVAPEHRGHDLFELLMVDGLLYAYDAGFRLVFGGMRPDRRFRPFVEELGFRDYGLPYLANFPPGKEMDQSLVTETRGNRPLWAARKRAALVRLRSKGFDIIDRGCSVAPAIAEGQT